MFYAEFFARRADLVLLDVMLPGEDSFAFCRRARQTVDCPILFLTAREAERDAVQAVQQQTEQLCRLHGLTLEFAAQGSPEGLVPLALLQRAASNLLQNAVEHTPAGGALCCRCTAQGGWLTLTNTPEGHACAALAVPLRRAGGEA